VIALAAAFFLSLLLAFGLTPLGVRVAWATGHLDRPAERKMHSSSTALLGGVVVFVCAFAGWGLARLFTTAAVDRDAITLVSGASIALLLGLWDDRVGMGPGIKLLGQAAAIATLISSGNLPSFGLPPEIAGPLLVLALVGLMNACNFLDNMNGMLGGLAAIALLAFGVHSAWRGAHGTAAAQFALAGACAGFLPWNFPRARIFLGDAGSLFLGYSLGASAVLACHGASTGWGRIGAALVIAYPVFDIVFVVINRLRDGRKVYTGGRDHTNHRLASVIGCPKRTVLLLWLNGAALSASGLVVLFLDRPLPALLLSGLWIGLFLWVGTKLSAVPELQVSRVPA
jgi:UDP-GlcNAc:undecaprenyl-phosphate GlcNAc-1-phosphate transferase